MNKLKTMRHPVAGERGVAAVEFAFVAPLLFLIFFAIVNWGIYLFDKAVITNAVREGARWASINAQAGTCSSTSSTAPTDPCQVAYNYASSNLITFGSNPGLQACFGPLSGNGCGTVTTAFSAGSAQQVSMTYTFTGTGFGVSEILAGAGQITATALMYHE